jgi:hypothetical protein
MKTVLRLWAFMYVVLVFCVSSRVQAEDTIRVYIDADQTHMSAAGQVIEWGVRAALASVENRLCGYRVVVLTQTILNRWHFFICRWRLQMKRFIALPLCICLPNIIVPKQDWKQM